MMSVLIFVDIQSTKNDSIFILSLKIFPNFWQSFYLGTIDFPNIIHLVVNTLMLVIVWTVA